jgi:uncharacterized membrane protein
MPRWRSLTLGWTSPSGPERGGIAVMTGWSMGLEAWAWMGAWALVLGLAVWILVRVPHRDETADAAAILRERFARGEITEDEFRRATAALASERRAARR